MSEISNPADGNVANQGSIAGMAAMPPPYNPAQPFGVEPPRQPTNGMALCVTTSTPQMTSSPSINKLAMALCKAQKAMKQPSKGADNPFFKSKYADLNDVWEAARSVLADQGLCVIQTPSFEVGLVGAKTVGHITISTTIVHGESGQWITNVLRGISDQIGPQAVGSAISYFRRYSLQPLLMITPDDGSDDDAEKAEGRTHAPAGAPPPDPKLSPDDIAKHTAAIKGAPSVDALKAAYEAIPEAHRKPFNKLVNARKAAIEKAAAPVNPVPTAEQTPEMAEQPEMPDPVEP